MKAKAAARLELEQSRREVALWGGARDVHPAQALLQLVQHKAAEVEYWRWRVAQLDPDSLLWGVTRDKQGGQDYGTTTEAKPNAALVQLHEAEKALAEYAAASIKAGCDAAMVELAKGQAARLLAVMTRMLSDPRVTVTVEPNVVVADALQAEGLA